MRPFIAATSGRYQMKRPVAPVLDQSGMRQLLEMERERGRRQLEAERNGAGCQSVTSVLDEQAKDRQARLLRECSQSRHCSRRVGNDGLDFPGSLFHISNTIEIYNEVKLHRDRGFFP